METNGFCYSTAESQGCFSMSLNLIGENASVDDIRNVARSQGMTTLRESGLKLIFDGVTTIDEVVRETILDGGD
jgi:type IV pilus assembly protein PilB